MRIFVTGATGYIGRALCRRLATDGHAVQALVRSPDKAAPLRDAGVATFVGDVTERVSLREGMAGADWVIHAAAQLDLGVPSAEMARVNVEGSENVASLAYKLGVGALLSISSVAAWGGSPDDGSPADESSPVRRPFPTPYSATKYDGQRAIEEWGKRGLRLRTVYPGLVYGPPGKKEGANSFLRQLLLGRFPALVGADRRSSWVFLDDVVEAILRVMSVGQDGRGYLLAGEVVTVRDLARRVAELSGTPAPRREMPVGLAHALLSLGTPWYRLRGRRPPIPPAQLASLRRHWAFDDRRARTELEWHPRPLAVGLPPTLEYIRQQERDHGGRVVRG
ncbi:MAG: NAD-dependent epimerase/dehydratase family protein [Holophagales bacterium]|nr:MAG: NAD-dependent epimerase/dehydratase family protein [Holophagales bacterium]